MSLARRLRRRPARRPAASSPAVRALFLDSLGRAGRRICAQARSMSKKPSKFLDWLDGDLRQERFAFRLTINPVLAVLAEVCGSDADGLLKLLELQCFDVLLRRLMILCENNTATLIPVLVDRACTKFEAELAGRLLPLVFPQDAA